MNRKKRAWRIMDTAIMVIVVIILAVVLWMLLDGIAKASPPDQWFCQLRMGQEIEWRCTAYWGCGRYRVSKPMWCCGGRCRAACYDYRLRSWGPCY